MKILILANNDMGLYKFRKELLEALIAAGHTVFLSLPNGPFIPQLQELGCKFIETPVDRRGTNPIADCNLYLNYKKLLKTISPDIVFTYTIKPNIYGGIACQACHIPYLANITGLGTSIENGGLIQKIALFLYRKGLQGAKKIFFQNQYNMDFMLKKHIVAEKQCALLPGSGVNVNHFQYTQYPPEDNGVHFLFIGRIMKDKGIEELLTAFQRLKNETPSASLTLVGEFDGSYQEQVSRLHQEGLLNFLGTLQDVRPEIAKAHCIVLPSYHEGMANVLLEASAMGRPVIATDVPGCKETYDDGLSGLSCKATDSQSLYQRLSEFARMPWLQKETMGKAANLKIKRQFNRAIVIQKYSDELRLYASK